MNQNPNKINSNDNKEHKKVAVGIFTGLTAVAAFLTFHHSPKSHESNPTAEITVEHVVQPTETPEQIARDVDPNGSFDERQKISKEIQTQETPHQALYGPVNELDPGQEVTAHVPVDKR